MHEIILAKSIYQIVIAKKETVKVKQVKVAIGKAHHLEESSLQKAWKELTFDTELRGAILMIQRPDLVFRCYDCHHECIGIEGDEWRCTRCHSSGLEIVGGREMDVLSLIQEESDGN